MPEMFHVQKLEVSSSVGRELLMGEFPMYSKWTENEGKSTCPERRNIAQDLAVSTILHDNVEKHSYTKIQLSSIRFNGVSDGLLPCRPFIRQVRVCLP
ncbi:hypothetical protein T07_1785 [Trichinella nelsoni]|uniref:Uncharacterized protein n=1 Tax=Trichinella nelsoni TaxID=6336 RepID=A0A0V0RP18_9BILA|nr:hypothetical protein T07_1785 [Trichinella nelsoni]